MTPLDRLLRDLVAAEGPIPLDRYMALCLGHPAFGYYATRDPIGAAGDFTTAPEISQVFGELLGLWAAETWRLMGRPSPVLLVELGPGRGTLLADALRATRTAPGFRDALRLHLVETSPVLRAAQARALADANPTWHDGIDTLPPGPAIVLANEFLDALPVRHVVRGREGWHERLVGLGPDGELAFGLSPGALSERLPDGEPGEVREIGVAAALLVAALARRLSAEGGAALLVDYGHAESRSGETLQAVRGHAPADPLARPGETDLTAHVDFAAASRVARAAGALVHGPVGQGAFLRSLGIGERAAALARRASPESAERLASALRRLAGPGPDGMGELFKVLALSGPTLPVLPGLPASAPPC